MRSGKITPHPCHSETLAVLATRRVRSVGPLGRPDQVRAARVSGGLRRICETTDTAAWPPLASVASSRFAGDDVVPTFDLRRTDVRLIILAGLLAWLIAAAIALFPVSGT